MQKGILSCVIIDDDPATRQTIEDYISRIPFLRLQSAYQCAKQALNEIRTTVEVPDLVLLDIQIPELKGYGCMDIFNSMNSQVVVMTDDPSQAIDGYFHQITDYLLKPVAFERFIRSITNVVSGKAIKAALSKRVVSKRSTSSARQESARKLMLQNTEDQPDFIFLRQKRRLIRVDIAELHLIESSKDYVRVFWAGNVTMVHMALAKFLSLLPGEPLLRISKSQAVKKTEIVEMEGKFVKMKDGKKLPVGLIYEKLVIEHLCSVRGDANP